MTQEFLAGTIDHTLLKPDAESHQFTQLFEEAAHYGFHSVCVNPSRVEEANKFLKDNQVKVCSVVGFPLGASTTSTKLQEMESCILDGAVEIDMVMNIGYFKDGNLDYVADEIVQIVNSSSGNILKVIIETNLLNDDEISQASKLVEDSGAQFVKTSTGFYGSSATPDLVRSIRGQDHRRVHGDLRDVDLRRGGSGFSHQLGQARGGPASGMSLDLSFQRGSDRGPDRGGALLARGVRVHASLFLAGNHDRDDYLGLDALDRQGGAA